MKPRFRPIDPPPRGGWLTQHDFNSACDIVQDRVIRVEINVGRVISGAAVDFVDGVVDGPDQIIAGGAGESVLAETAEERVIALATAEAVKPLAALDEIIPGEAQERIAAEGADDRIVSG